MTVITWRRLGVASVVLGGVALASAGCGNLLGFEDFSAADADSGTRIDDASVDPEASTDGATRDTGRPPASGIDGGSPLPDASADAGLGTFLDAASDSAGCANACTMGTSQCVGGAVQRCQAQASGCTQWVTTTTCGAHEVCVADAGGAWACACAPSVCTQAGKQCESLTTLDTCAMDAKCAYVASSISCAAPTTCSGQAPTAACASTCTDSCTKGQIACSSAGVQTCTLGSNGCYAYATTATCVGAEECTVTAGKAACTCHNDAACLSVPGNTCSASSNATSYVTCQKDVAGCFKQTGTPTPCASSQVCTGSPGAASCTCRPDPVCRAAGTYCSASTVVTCTQDAQHCWQHTASATCANGTCTGAPGSAACCTNGCTTGAKQCGSATAVQTCQAPANACATWVSQACAGGNVCERHGGASCVDPTWAEWPMPNAAPDTPTAPYPASYTDGNDGTITDNWTGLIWQKMVSGTYTWQAAASYCSALRVAGYADWRLPASIELISLVDPGHNSPSINPTFFPGTSASAFWTSTPVAGGTDNAWAVWFGTGVTERDARATALATRCVR